RNCSPCGTESRREVTVEPPTWWLLPGRKAGAWSSCGRKARLGISTTGTVPACSRLQQGGCELLRGVHDAPVTTSTTVGRLRPTAERSSSRSAAGNPPSDKATSTLATIHANVSAKVPSKSSGFRGEFVGGGEVGAESFFGAVWSAEAVQAE